MKHIIGAFNRNTSKILFLLVFSVVNLLFMHYFIYFNHYIEDIMLAYEFGYNLFSVSFDVSVLFLFFLIFTWKRPKVNLLLIFATTWLWSFANVFYARFFGQYISLSVFNQTGNLTDQAVMNSMMAGFQFSDLFYPVILIFFICVYRKVGILTINRKVFFAFLLVPLCALIFTCLTYSIYHVLKSDTRGNTELFLNRIDGIIKCRARNSFPNKVRFTAGSIRVIGWEIYDMFNILELSQEQKDMITMEYADMSQRISCHKKNDSIRNVVFIVLESFLSAPIDLIVDGKEITPFLNTLKKDSLVYYNGHVASNITLGESGDGQFILMTGILPLRDKLTVGEAKTLELPSFPKLLKKKYGSCYTEIVMPSPPQVWEQVQMNHVYGIDEMYCNRDVLGDVTDYLNDEQVFSMAMKTVSSRKQPFFSLILSYSTHQPYRTPVDNSFTLSDKSLTNSYINYLISCHYADSWVRQYLDFLKRTGVYDNSLIVITADHHAHMDALGMGKKVKKELPLFIINGNIDTVNAWTGDMNQLDIYTTLLDVLGIESAWHGLGHTILSPTYKNSLTEKAWTVSELIVKGRYFDTNETNSSVPEK